MISAGHGVCHLCLARCQTSSLSETVQNSFFPKLQNLSSHYKSSRIKTNAWNHFHLSPKGLHFGFCFALLALPGALSQLYTCDAPGCPSLLQAKADTGFKVSCRVRGIVAALGALPLQLEQKRKQQGKSDLEKTSLSLGDEGHFAQGIWL